MGGESVQMGGDDRFFLSPPHEWGENFFGIPPIGWGGTKFSPPIQWGGTTFPPPMGEGVGGGNFFLFPPSMGGGNAHP